MRVKIGTRHDAEKCFAGTAPACVLPVEGRRRKIWRHDGIGTDEAGEVWAEEGAVERGKGRVAFPAP